jgi:protein phosphatase
MKSGINRERPSSLLVGRMSSPGNRRRGNQDTVLWHVPPEAVRLAYKGALFVVADGMRGCPAGEVASCLAARALLHAYYGNPWFDPIQGLWKAVGTADGWVRYWAAARADLRGMGTTLTAASVRRGELTIAHVGDSRAYLVRNGYAWPLTRDHTWAADAHARGLLSRQEARSHPWRHVLTRSLGGRSATVDVLLVAYRSGDRLVLCSDGVSDLLAPAEIAWLAARSPGRAAKAVVETARRRGGRDDASAIVVALDGRRQRRQSVTRARHFAPRPRRVQTGEHALLLLLGLAAAGMMLMAGVMALAL